MQRSTARIICGGFIYISLGINLALASEKPVAGTESVTTQSSSAAAEIATTSETTEGRVDQTQKQFSGWIDRTSHQIDDWFGVPDPENPASASLRLILDTRWNRYDELEIRPRIRGKIRLPTLENKLSVVFGDDTLDNELNNHVAIRNENPSLASDDIYDRSRTREENASIALRWSQLFKTLDLKSDIDLGLRSGDDLYIRLEVSKDWQLQNHMYTSIEQIYRYGSDSENYLRTNIEFSYIPPASPFLSNEFSLIYADAQQDDLLWHNYSFRQHQFFHAQRFNYGIHTSGYYNHDDTLHLNTWGPFISWRQPLWREWFLVQGDLNYFNDDRLKRDHHPSVLFRLEALF